MQQQLPPPTAAQVITAAISAAGRSAIVAQALGVTKTAVVYWGSKGRIPADRIVPLCDMGRHVVTPTQILEAMAREAQEKAAV